MSNATVAIVWLGPGSRAIGSYSIATMLGQLQAAGFDAVAGEDYAALALPRPLVVFEADRT